MKTIPNNITLDEFLEYYCQDEQTKEFLAKWFQENECTVEDLEDQIDSQSDRIYDLGNELDECRSEISELEDQIIKLDCEIFDLRDELSEAEETIKNLLENGED